MIQELLEEGVRQSVFPSAQAAVIRDGREVLFRKAGSADETTCFDVASITKVVSTTAIFLRLWSQSKVSPDDSIQSICPKAAPGITLADLLSHRAGLPGFVPYFPKAMAGEPRLFSADCPPQIRQKVRDRVVALAFQTKPSRKPGATVEYSDVGFIWVGEALATIAALPLDTAFEKLVASPLEIDIRFHRLSRETPYGPCAPTGQKRPRDPAPGQEGLWPAIKQWPTTPGEVDDDNAWVMDGVAGHSGLFATARELAAFGNKVLEELGGANRIAPPALWNEAIRVDDTIRRSTRAFGFDTPTKSGRGALSSAGTYMARSSAIGHLGFTGSSLWIDLKRKLVVALCTNRTFLGRGNDSIKEFRPRFHDAVIEELGLTRGV